MTTITTITITGLRKMSEPKQQEVGQSILVGLYHAGVEVDGVSVGFEEEDL